MQLDYCLHGIYNILLIIALIFVPNFPFEEWIWTIWDFLQRKNTYWKEKGLSKW